MAIYEIEGKEKKNVKSQHLSLASSILSRTPGIKIGPWKTLVLYP